MQAPAPTPAPRPMDDLLFGAVHLHSMRTRGQPAASVTVHYLDGSAKTMTVPPRNAGSAEPVPEAPPAWPPAEGWAFRPGEAAFNGTRFRVAGKLLAILRELAVRPGEPVTWDRLKRAVWGEEPDLIEDGNLQGHVSQVRKILRAALALEEAFNPVPTADRAYRLAVY